MDKRIMSLAMANSGQVSVGNSASFRANFADAGSGAVDLTLSRGTGSATFTRAGATAYTRNSSGAWIGPIAANVARSGYTAAGVYIGYIAEEARTNHFLNSAAPITQTSASLGTGSYTLWMEGTGSVAVAQNTATITGAGTATAGSPVTFTVTVLGTVTYTVTGSPTIVQSEDGAFATSYIATAGAAVTRGADSLFYPSAGNVSVTSGTCAALVSCASFANGCRMVSLSDTLERPALFANGGTNIAIFDGATIVNGPAVGAVNVATRYASRWSGVAMQAASNGVNGTAGVFDGNMDVGTNIGVGFSPTAGLPINGGIRDVRIWNTDLGASVLPTL